MTGWWPGATGRAVRGLRQGALLIVLLLAVDTAMAAQPALPDVDIVLAVEVYDAAAWLSMHDEVLGTPREALKPLGLSIAGSGGRRWITLNQPKFATDILLTDDVRTLKIVVTGKIAGAEALGSLTPFTMAVTAAQEGAVQNWLTMLYGVSGVSGRLLELQISRP